MPPCESWEKLVALTLRPGVNLLAIDWAPMVSDPTMLGR
jgi:hypothetical protein